MTSLERRDGGVFDNLPYSMGKSKFAKKDLYDRIRGKDWPGRSLKPQNVFSALKERFGKKAKVRLEDAERADDKEAECKDPYVLDYDAEDKAGNSSDQVVFALDVLPYQIYF